MQSVGGIGLFEIAFVIFLLLAAAVAVGGTIFWIWMLIDCATKESNEGSDKIVWIIIILLAHLLGALIYFFVRRPKRIEATGE